jgi:tRNA (cytidine/uridine-2'-O-)-methyltransferase
MNIILYQPEIPPNTGNVARLCAGLGLTLHLIEPLGFSLDDKNLKRAGLDYWPLVSLKVWPSWVDFRAAALPGRLVATSARGGELFSAWSPLPDDNLLFGRESTGLPESVLAQAAQVLHLPLQPGIRSLNLSTTAGLFMGLALAKLPNVLLPSAAKEPPGGRVG